MSQLLCWINVAAGLILFFAMSGISSNWVLFSTPEAKIFPFILGILLLGNGVYLAFASEASWAQRR